VCNQRLSMLRSEQVSNAIKSGVNRKIADGHNLYLVVKNAKGFWVYSVSRRQRDPQQRTRLRCQGHACAGTASARSVRVRAARGSAIARRSPLYATGRQVRGCGRCLLANHADKWGERHRAGLKAVVRMHAGALADVPVNRITTEQIADTLRPIWNGPGNSQGNRLRRLIETILTAKRVEPNPATWARLREIAFQEDRRGEAQGGHGCKGHPSVDGDPWR
jgi:hypothetical protein